METPGLIVGVVVDTSDPQEMGRMKVWCPAVDGDDINPDTLPWVLYTSPLLGQAIGYPAGGAGSKNLGPISYGFWAVPKLGAQVLIGFLYDDYNQRVFLGCLPPAHGNRSLPAGRNSVAGPTTDSTNVLEPATSNLKAQFQGDLTSSIALTRGAYERQVAQAADDKTDDEGYSTRGVGTPYKGKGTLDPQTYCITTPGRHSVIMQDDPRRARVRIKTAEGNQVILDDANERIYVSTAHGRTWIELDRDGHVHLYGAESVSVSAGADLNLSAKGDVNVHAGGNMNLAAGGYLRGSACSDVSLSGDGGVNITSGAAFDILASGTLTQTGSTIHLNGPGAATAPCASTPKITPSHEPWRRPAAAQARGPNWKE